MVIKKVVISFVAFSFLIFSSGVSEAASKKKIDKRVVEAIAEFKDKVSGAEELLNKAAGFLIFPKVTKAGIGIGGERGEGALIIGGNTVDYYRTTSASVGLQLGFQTRKQFMFFMTDDALDGFRNSSGWEVGVDGSVALIEIGAGGAIDTNTIDQPVIGFILSNKGLMYNLTLEGTKIKKIKK